MSSAPIDSEPIGVARSIRNKGVGNLIGRMNSLHRYLGTECIQSARMHSPDEMCFERQSAQMRCLHYRVITETSLSGTCLASATTYDAVVLVA